MFGSRAVESRIFNHERALAKMVEHDLVALVGATFTNSYYVSGVRTLYNDWYFSEPYQAAIVPIDPLKKPTLVTMTVFLPALVEDVPTWMPNIRLYDWYAIDKTPEPPDVEDELFQAIQELINDRVTGDVENDIVTATVKAFRDLGITSGRVGFDDLRFGGFVQEHLPGIEVVDAHQIFQDIKKVRTKREIQLLAYAARVNQLALDAVIWEMRPGVNWRDLAALFKETWMKHGGRAVSDKGLYWGGTFRGKYVPDTFYLPNNNFVIEEGKYYLLEGEGHVLQYHSDCNRTVFIGEPPKSYLKGVDAVMRAYRAIESMIRPGRTTREVYQTVREVMKTEGVPYPGKTLVATHGVGLEFVEWYGEFPTCRGIPESYLIEEGQTWGMDVLYYGHTLGTFHFENGLLITAEGPRSFFAPPNTDFAFYGGLVVKDGERIETYCPGDVKLVQESGIPEEFVLKDIPVPY